MSASTVADFIVGYSGDAIGFPPGTVVGFPPVYVTDIASKAYVDASFPGGAAGGSSYSGLLNFSVADTPLYGSAGADAVEFTVNRVGNMVTLNMGPLDTNTTDAGYTLLATGLPAEYRPAPLGSTTPGASVGSGGIYIAQLGTVPGITWETSQFGVGSDGYVRIKTNRRLGVGGRCRWLGASLSYLTDNVGA